MTYWETLPASAIPARNLVEFGWSGLQSLAPNLMGLLAGRPAPPLPNFPERPEQVPANGKVPSWEDPRIGLAQQEAALLLSNLMPFGGTARGTLTIARLMGLTERGGGAAMRDVAESLASRSPRMYNPPAKPPRPFAADHPAGAPADAAGQLTADIEGRPLLAEYVAGRRMVGGPDQPLGASEVVGVATGAAGRGPAMVTPGQFRDEIGGSLGGAGRLIKDIDRRSGAADYRIFVDSRLPPESSGKVTAHEVGHLIDEIAGRIPVAGLNTELRQVYNSLNTGRERTTNLTGPQHLGYHQAEVPRELMSEAIRAYMVDPNYLKTVAPKTAAVIRDAVNAHPILSKVIQFNSIAGPMGPMLGLLPAEEPRL
jgi:hypothetical protein